MRKPDKSPFVVLTGDIVRSRRLGKNKRARIQAQLNKTLVQINRDYKKSICTPLQFTGGDEFQGVFETAVPVFDVINRIREVMSPVSVRFGIGIGEITTPLSDQPQAMDGPAFHRARDALERAQEFVEQACVSSGKPEQDEEVNAWFDALSSIRSRWSSRALQVIHLYEDFQKLEPIAKKLRISVQAVSKHLRVTGYKAYKRGESALKRLLAAYNDIQPKKVEYKKST
jgi:hypothetical protein